MSNSWKIRDLVIENRIIVGPMAGISNEAFRVIAKKFGAGLIYSEMVSDKALVYKNKKTHEMTKVVSEERPLAMQLFGHDIDSMVEAAKFLDTESDCDIIDINMGCPVTKIVKANSGSALMKDVEHASNIVRSIVNSVSKPVTVKIRAGWNLESINAVEMAIELEKAGASAIAVHPRTKMQMYEGKSNWDIIRQVKEVVSIPVIGNGDILSVDDALRMFEETKCDAVMIARGVLGNPWLIKELNETLTTGKISQAVSLSDKFEMALEHARKLIELKGEKVAMKEMRGHACWYIHGLPHNNKVKALLSKMTKYDNFEEILVKYQNSIENEEYNWLLL